MPPWSRTAGVPGAPTARAGGAPGPIRARPSPRAPEQAARAGPPQETVAVAARLPALPHPLLATMRTSGPQTLLLGVALPAAVARRAASGPTLPPQGEPAVEDVVPTTPAHRTAAEGAAGTCGVALRPPARPVLTHPAQALLTREHPRAATPTAQTPGVPRALLIAPGLAAPLAAARREGVRPASARTTAAAGTPTARASIASTRPPAVVPPPPGEGRGAASRPVVLPGEAIAVPAPVAGTRAAPLATLLGAAPAAFRRPTRPLGVAPRVGVANEPRLVSVGVARGVVAAPGNGPAVGGARRRPRREGRAADAEPLRTAREAAIPASPDPRPVLPVRATVEPRTAVALPPPAVAHVEAEVEVAKPIGAAGAQRAMGAEPQCLHRALVLPTVPAKEIRSSDFPPESLNGQRTTVGGKGAPSIPACSHARAAVGAAATWATTPRQPARAKKPQLAPLPPASGLPLPIDAPGAGRPPQRALEARPPPLAGGHPTAPPATGAPPRTSVEGPPAAGTAGDGPQTGNPPGTVATLVGKGAARTLEALVPAAAGVLPTGPPQQTRPTRRPFGPPLPRPPPLAPDVLTRRRRTARSAPVPPPDAPLAAVGHLARGFTPGPQSRPRPRGAPRRRRAAVAAAPAPRPGPVPAARARPPPVGVP